MMRKPFEDDGPILNDAPEAAEKSILIRPKAASRSFATLKSIRFVITLNNFSERRCGKCFG
jgi:hypothetical protein